MEFTFKGELKFSKNAEKALKDIEAFIDQANNEILLKGIPQGHEDDAPRIVEWELTGDALKLTIESKNRGKAHDAIRRIKKPLLNILGPKYHIGIRGTQTLEKYVSLGAPADWPQATPTQREEYYNKVFPEIEATPLVLNTDYSDKGILTYYHVDDESINKHHIDRSIKHVRNIVEEIPVLGDSSTEESNEDADDILTRQVTKIEPGTIVGRSPKFPVFFEGDPTEEAAKQGWVKKFPGKGQWFYGPKFIALQRAIEDIFREVLVEKLEFYECMWPKLIPIPVMNKMRYLEGLPEGMYYCSAPRRDPEVFKKFKNELLIKKEVPIDRLKDGLKDPSYVLAPAQCEPFYEFFSHEVLDEKELPIKLFDKSGWTYRWEAGGAKGLDRVHEFQRTELVWLGMPEQVEEIRDATLEISQELANQMELEWYTEIGDDPFYLEGRKVEERGIEFPDIPKYEMRLVVPGADKGVAAVSANVHGTHFTEGFSIKETHNHTLWTGCTGIGTTRWLFGFLAQKGFDEANWPTMVKERVNNVRTPNVLTWP
jgi:seryl-tRNA synthetase